jgi:hypothetical protein
MSVVQSSPTPAAATFSHVARALVGSDGQQSDSVVHAVELTSPAHSWASWYWASATVHDDSSPWATAATHAEWDPAASVLQHSRRSAHDDAAVSLFPGTHAIAPVTPRAMRIDTPLARSRGPARRARSWRGDVGRVEIVTSEVPFEADAAAGRVARSTMTRAQQPAMSPERRTRNGSQPSSVRVRRCYRDRRTALVIAEPSGGFVAGLPSARNAPRAAAPASSGPPRACGSCSNSAPCAWPGRRQVLRVAWRRRAQPSRA